MLKRILRILGIRRKKDQPYEIGEYIPPPIDGRYVGKGYGYHMAKRDKPKEENDDGNN